MSSKFNLQKWLYLVGFSDTPPQEEFPGVDSYDDGSSLQEWESAPKPSAEPRGLGYLGKSRPEVAPVPRTIEPVPEPRGFQAAPVTPIESTSSVKVISSQPEAPPKPKSTTLDTVPVASIEEYEDFETAGRYFLEKEAVIVDLQGASSEDHKRVFDSLVGLAFGADAQLTRTRRGVYFLRRRHIRLSKDCFQRLRERDLVL